MRSKPFWCSDLHLKIASFRKIRVMDQQTTQRTVNTRNIRVAHHCKGRYVALIQLTKSRHSDDPKGRGETGDSPKSPAKDGLVLYQGVLHGPTETHSGGNTRIQVNDESSGVCVLKRYPPTGFALGVPLRNVHVSRNLWIGKEVRPSKNLLRSQSDNL